MKFIFLLLLLVPAGVSAESSMKTYITKHIVFVESLNIRRIPSSGSVELLKIEMSFCCPYHRYNQCIKGEMHGHKVYVNNYSQKTSRPAVNFAIEDLMYRAMLHCGKFS